MLKLVIVGCLCTILLVKAQEGPPPPPPPPEGAPPKQIENNRVARQVPQLPSGGMPSMPNMQGNPGNFGMPGFGNMPDPKALMAKAQEIGKQFLGVRRRRQVPTTTPLMP